MDVSSQKSGITGKLPFSQRNMKCNRYNKCMLDVPSFQIRPTYSCNISTQTTYEVVQDGTECGYIKHRQNTSACFLEVEFKHRIVKTGQIEARTNSLIVTQLVRIVDFEINYADFNLPLRYGIVVTNSPQVHACRSQTVITRALVIAGPVYGEESCFDTDHYEFTIDTPSPSFYPSSVPSVSNAPLGPPSFKPS